MGIYTNIKESTTTNFENFLEAEENITAESLGEGFVAAYTNVLEMELNWANMHKAIALDELAYLEENGTEVIYEASKFKGFLASVKKFFTSVWEKIVAMFNKFMSIINQFVLSDRQFVATYSKKVKDANISGLEIEGFDYKIKGRLTAGSVWKNMKKKIDAAFTHDATTDAEAAVKELEDFTNNKDHELKELRACVGVDACEAKEFGKELFKYFRSGKEKAEKLSTIDAAKELAIITNTKISTEEAKNDLSQTKTIINGIISELNKEEQKLIKAFPDGKSEAKSSAAVRQVNAKVGLSKDAIGILNLYMGAKLSALKSQNRQAKAICAKIATYKVKDDKKAVGESFIDQETGFGSHQESVIFI